MASLKVENLSKTYGRKTTAVSGLSFEVADQEFVFLLGPSGAGKTTTLRMIAGLEQPDTGEVLIGGMDLTDASPRERNVAMVYDKNSLYPHLSVYENMAYPLRLRKMPSDEMDHQIQRVAKILRIEHLLQRRSRELSGGQQQRVAIGRMLVKKADIYLMDEPISHLDAKLRAHMRLEFKKLQREFSATILYVSHDQLEAMTMGDRIVVMNEGVVQQIGTPRDVFDRPANMFVAGFVGEPSMNIFDCELRIEERIPRLVFGQQAIKLSPEWLSAHPTLTNKRSSLSIGIRPQHLSVTQNSGEDNALSGTVYAAETLGSETIIDLEIEGLIIRALVKNKFIGSLNTNLGVPMQVKVDLHSIYLFDRLTGITLVQADVSSLEPTLAHSSQPIATKTLASPVPQGH